VSSAQGSSLRSSSEASARRDNDSPKSAVLRSSRNGSLVSSRQNSKKHLPRKDSNVLLSRVSEQLLEVSKYPPLRANMHLFSANRHVSKRI
jgi:hypothetical protein